jgi:Flp pilus assembly protein TadB
MLLRAGMSRGRDSFYAAAGASAVVALLIMAFGNPGLFATSVLIIVATVLGLALAQSRSRTTQ